MSTILKSILVVLSISSTHAYALECITDTQETYTVQPGTENTIDINGSLFNYMKVEEFSDDLTNIHSTWLQDENGVIALLSVITKNDNVQRTIHVIEGDVLKIGECQDGNIHSTSSAVR